MSEALHLKYRPATFDDVVGAGNEGTIRSLQSIIKRPAKKRPHAFLFTGPSGCGKTTLVRILKEELGCANDTFYEVDASKDRSVHNIRQIVNSSKMPTLRSGGIRIYLIDEAHHLEALSQDTLLKALEDCPPHAYFCIATTDPDRLKPAIRTRCTTYQVHSLTEKETRLLLKDIAAKEEVEVPKAVLKAIAKKAAGSAREAVKLLDQVLGLLEDEEHALGVIEGARGVDEEVGSIAKILLKPGIPPDKRFQDCKLAIKNLKEEQVESARIGLLRYFTAVVLNQPGLNKRLINIMELFQEPMYSSGRAGLLIQTMYACVME